MELLANSSNLTIAEIAKELLVSTRAIEKQLAKLKKQRKIERVGPDKGGYWKIIT